MNESSRPSKKRKASIVSNTVPMPAPEVASLEKSSNFWIDDGNVVLRTATKQYRIHRGLLSMHSSVFRDMFSIPQPAEQQTIEDVPIIEVTDSAEDWDLLFPVIYGMKSMYAPGTTVIPVSLMVAMLRLGRKYDLERFKQEALEQLETFFPDSLEKWDRLFDISLEALQDIMGDRILELVHIAVDLNLRRALPVGFLTCIRERSMDDIIVGTDAAGALVLSRGTQNKLILGKETLIQAAADYSMAWFFDGPLSGTCRQPEDCRSKIQHILKQMAKNLAVAFSLDPPAYAGHFDGLCSQCAKEAETRNLAGRQEMFRMLPLYFGLEPWDQLKDDV